MSYECKMCYACTLVVCCLPFWSIGVALESPRSSHRKMTCACALHLGYSIIKQLPAHTCCRQWPSAATYVDPRHNIKLWRIALVASINHPGHSWTLRMYRDWPPCDLMQRSFHHRVTVQWTQQQHTTRAHNSNTQAHAYNDISTKHKTNRLLACIRSSHGLLLTCMKHAWGAAMGCS